LKVDRERGRERTWDWEREVEKRVLEKQQGLRRLSCDQRKK